MFKRALGFLATVCIVFVGFIAPNSAQAATNWEAVNVSSSPFVDTLADGTVVTVTFGIAGGYWGASHPPAFYKSDASGGIQTSFVRFTFSRPITSLKTYYAYLGVGDQSQFRSSLGDVNLAQNFPTGNLISSTGNFISGQPAGSYASNGVITSLSGDRSATLELAFSSGITWLEFKGVPSGSGISGINLTGLELLMTSHSLLFDSNGGQGSMPSQVGYAPGSIEQNTFTRQGYNFDGWTTSPNGSGTPYANGANFSFSTDQTLYAQWTLIPSPSPSPAPTPTPTPTVSPQGELAATGNTFGMVGIAGLSLLFSGLTLSFLRRSFRN